ncbi:Aste57867_10779 [Aphanomyces stellatus]|uniref:Aste57867_10779 protein n=1 Tax=Aphanomyces stellatus TaxID=120398 RepID=A0A485KSW7_9STRA|nr:hypothetical protein As57867_010739 [Aphanomyces stellatus]VFT87649.1 Aste57867_10779 [Aphanomyces stellatus]
MSQTGGALSGHFQKKQKTPQAAAPAFQFGFNAAPSVGEVTEQSPEKTASKKKKKKAKAPVVEPADAPAVPVAEASSQDVTAPVDAEVATSIKGVADVSLGAKANKKKKKKKAKKKPAAVEVPEKKDFEFLFTFDKVGFSEAELAEMDSSKSRASSKKAGKAKPRPTTTPAVTAPPAAPMGLTNYMTLRKATDNSSEVQKMQLRYGKGKRIHTPKKKDDKAAGAPKTNSASAGSTFKFNF